MDILLIGPSEAGKTTHLATTYGMLRDGITIKSGRYFGKGDLCFTYDENLSSLYSDLMRGKYPDSTHRIRGYETHLVWDHSIIGDFNLVDTVGGRLGAIPGTSEYQQMRDRVIRSDYILVYFSIEDILYRSIDPIIADRLSREMKNLSDFLSEKQHSQRITAVSIVVSKSDLIESIFEEREAIEFFRGILEMNSNYIYVFLNFTSCKLNWMENVIPPMASLMTMGLYSEHLNRAFIIGKENKRKKAIKALCRYLEATDGSEIWHRLRISL